MDTRHIMADMKFSGRKSVLFLAVFFIAWHPGFLGSESLTLTTYYPAPYGGYVGLLTTGTGNVNTILARNGGSVGIGITGVPSQKLDVNGSINTNANITASGNISAAGNIAATGNITANGSISAVGNISANNGNAVLSYTAGEGETLRLAGNNSTSVYLENLNGTFRIINHPWTAELMTVNQSGDLTLPSGRLLGVCTLRGYTLNGGQTCAWNERLFTSYGDNVYFRCGQLFQSGALEAGGNWTRFCYGADWSGTMLCCRIF